MGLDVPTLKLILRPILTVTSVWNTGENGDIDFLERIPTKPHKWNPGINEGERQNEKEKQFEH